MSDPKKNWDKILQEYSSGEEGDEHDIPNIASVKKNAEKLANIAAQLLHTVPDKLKEPQQKALNAGKGLLPREDIVDFKAIAKHIYSTPHPPPPTPRNN
jgi:hypothetical protein